MSITISAEAGCFKTAMAEFIKRQLVALGIASTNPSREPDSGKYADWSDDQLREHLQMGWRTGRIGSPSHPVLLYESGTGRRPQSRGEVLTGFIKTPSSC